MSEYGEKSAVMSTFKDGLVMDMNPMASKNTTLSDALNATFVTMRGNELVLQNDYGNGRIEKAYLPPGYIPIGMKEYGGIIYIASYNPLTNKGLVGSFPSPERNIDSQEWNTDEKKISWENFIDSSYEEKKSCSTFIAKLDIFGDKIIHSGDKYTIYFKDDPDNKESLKYLSNYFNTTEDDDYTKVTSPKNNTLTIKLAVVDSENNLRDITELCRRFDNAGDVIQFDINSSPVLKFNSGYFIQDPTVEINEKDYTSHSNEDFITERNKKAVNTYNNKISGLVYLIVELNVVQAFNVSTKAFKAGENGFSSYAIKYLELKIDPNTVRGEIEKGALYLILFEFNYKYNCPDGYYRSNLEALDDKLLQENPMLGDYSSYFGNNTASNILGSYLKHSTDDKERIIDFNGVEEGDLIKWSTEEAAHPIYDVNTGLYSKTLYKLVALGQLPESNTIFNYYCEPAMSYSRMPQLAVLGSINLSLIGGNSINITAWRYYNDATTNQTHLVVGLQETLPDNCAIINSYYEVFDIDKVNPDNDIEPLFTLLSQRSSYNGEYQEIYALREEDDDTALVWNHLYLMAIIVEVKEDAEDGTSTIHREVLGYRYFLGTLLFNTCFFNNSKVFAKDYMESFWNNASEHIDPNKYIFYSKEFDGETYYSNFKDEYSSIFSIPLELNNTITSEESKEFTKLGGVDEWADQNPQDDTTIQRVIYQNKISGSKIIMEYLTSPNLSKYPIEDFGDIVRGEYKLTELTKEYKYPNIKKNYIGQALESLIADIEVGDNVELYTELPPLEVPLTNKFWIKVDSDEDSSQITIKYNALYLSELYGQYTSKLIRFRQLYKPFLDANEKGFLNEDKFYPEASCKSLSELYVGTNLYSKDNGGTPLIYWPSFDNEIVGNWFIDKVGYKNNGHTYDVYRYRKGTRAFGTSDSNGHLHSLICIGPSHSLCESSKFWRVGTIGEEDDRWRVHVYYFDSLNNDNLVEILKKKMLSANGGTYYWRPLTKNGNDNLSCGWSNLFMTSYAKSLGLTAQSLLTWNTVTYNDNTSDGFTRITERDRLLKIGPNNNFVNTTEISGIKGWGIGYQDTVSETELKWRLDLYSKEPKMFSLETLKEAGVSPNYPHLCFRTKVENPNEPADNMRMIDLNGLSDILNIYCKKYLKIDTDNILNRKKLLAHKRSADYFYRSSLYLYTLKKYLNSFCIKTESDVTKEMYTFDPKSVGGIDDYTHHLDVMLNSTILLQEGVLEGGSTGKSIYGFITKLYNNTRYILDNYYTGESANETMSKLLSSMWFVLPKSLMTSISVPLQFNLRGTADNIKSFSESPAVAVLAEGSLIYKDYNGLNLISIGDLAVYGYIDGSVYPPDPSKETKLDFANVLYDSSQRALYYKEDLISKGITDVVPSSLQNPRNNYLAKRVYTYGNNVSTFYADIDPRLAGLSYKEVYSGSESITPEQISLNLLPFLQTCLEKAIQKYYS